MRRWRPTRRRHAEMPPYEVRRQSSLPAGIRPPLLLPNGEARGEVGACLSRALWQELPTLRGRDEAILQEEARLPAVICRPRSCPTDGRSGRSSLRPWAALRKVWARRPASRPGGIPTLQLRGELGGALEQECRMPVRQAPLGSAPLQFGRGERGEQGKRRWRHSEMAPLSRRISLDSALLRG